MNKIAAFFVLGLSLFSTTLLISQENEPVFARDNNMWQTLIMVGIAMLFFYFILWRPEQKRRKAVETLRSQLKKGDRVTAMGIVGEVSRIQEHTVVLKMIEGAKIEVLKGAITEIIPTGENLTSEGEARE